MVSRRVFFGMALGTSAGAVTQPAEALVCSPPSVESIPVRKTGRVEIAFASPGPQPNGLQAAAEGLWIVDQSPGSRVFLVDYDSGKVLRSFETDTVRPSGITFDGEALWIGSTFSYENVRVDARTGAVLERRPTPGCVMYSSS
jgi:sugar lactone lactonase YvrE